MPQYQCHADQIIVKIIELGICVCVCMSVSVGDYESQKTLSGSVLGWVMFQSILYFANIILEFSKDTKTI